MKKISSLFVVAIFILSIVLSFIPQVSADLVMPGKKNVIPCLEIENIKDYSKYKFVLYSTGVSMSLEEVKQDDCIEWYKFNQDIYVYAVPVDVFASSLIDEGDIETLEGLRGVLKTDKLEVSKYETVDESNLLQERKDIFKISKLDNSSFTLKKVKTEEVRSNENGGDKKEEDNDNTLLILGGVALVGVVAVGGFVGFSFLKSKKNKKK